MILNIKTFTCIEKTVADHTAASDDSLNWKGYLRKFTDTAWSINKIIPVSIGLETTTEVLADDSNAGNSESKIYLCSQRFVSSIGNMNVLLSHIL